MEYLNAYTWGHGSPRGFTKKSDTWKHSMDEMILSSGCDTLLLREAQEAAEKLLAEDPDLVTCPATAERIAELFTQAQDTLN